jgi:hypothetical protein
LASSSRKVSVEEGVWLLPTERHHKVGNAHVGRVQLDPEVGDRIGQGRSSFHRRGIDPVLDETAEGRALQERLPDDTVLPGDDRPEASRPPRKR